MGRVAALWRHPIKGHGAEPIERTRLLPGRTMTWDRVWAIAHEAARLKPDSGAWAPCANFSRGAKSPSLMAIRARTNEAIGRVRLSHPEQEPIEIDPDDPADQARLIQWVLPLSDITRARPTFVVRADRGMTDSPLLCVSVLNLASLDQLSRRTGRSLALERFRGNIWIEGCAPWDEFGWIGREIQVGAARLAIRERITRCKATTVDPLTGRPDADTLGALEANWGHTEFGVYAEVLKGGDVVLGDEVST